VIHALTDIGNFCLWGSSVLIVIFAIQYSLLAKWWRNPIGVTIVGLDLCILAIFVPSLLALADPGGFAHFATARWYLFLAVGVVAATFIFTATRIITWEYLRRKRRHLLPNGQEREKVK
jgi:hypothetical protein